MFRLGISQLSVDTFSQGRVLPGLAAAGGFLVKHDWKNFPELTDAQLRDYGFSSPHKQITESFRAKVIEVHDGDTIKVQWFERDFNFPVRFLDINTKELNEKGGKSTGDWLRGIIKGEMIDVRINPDNRVDKYGRLLGWIYHRGMNMGEWLMRDGRATKFEQRNDGKVPDINKILSDKQWF